MVVNEPLMCINNRKILPKMEDFCMAWF